jgi:hypothetical protein
VGSWSVMVWRQAAVAAVGMPLVDMPLHATLVNGWCTDGLQAHLLCQQLL